LSVVLRRIVFRLSLASSVPEIVGWSALRAQTPSRRRRLTLQWNDLMPDDSPADAGLVLVARAADFAARMHVSQRRKGAAQEPYLNHLAEVALLLGEATGGTDYVLVAAAWLHDTLEDTEAEREELEALFGREVASIVAEVTDDKSLKKVERKRLQIETAPHRSRQARLLKIADKTSNLRAMASSPPVGWDLVRRQEYIDWAEAVVAGCRGISPQLEKMFDAAAVEARTAIGGSR
jgi:(p)ppGpp synthase/HD superfamily hydrolase